MQIILNRERENGKRVSRMFILAENKDEQELIKKLEKAVKTGFGVGTVINGKLYLYQRPVINGKAVLGDGFSRAIKSETASALRRFFGQRLVVKKIKRYRGERRKYRGIVLMRDVKKKKKSRELFFSFLSLPYKRKINRDV